MIKALLEPTAEGTCKVVYCTEEGGEKTFGDVLKLSQQDEKEENVREACERRFLAFQQLVEILPDEEIILEWNDKLSQDAMLLISFTAIDHFLIGDFEMCAAMLEMLLELDPEDHTEASKMLAYSYVALEEFELFDEVINDVSDKYPDKDILTMWSEFRQDGELPSGELIHFKKNKVFFDEFITEDHPITDEYIADIESEQPSKKALARELWLQTEHLWKLYPDFIEALKKEA